MRTLVEDEFEPRPQFKPTINTSTGSATSVNVSLVWGISTTAPLLPDPPREPYRTKAFVDRRPEVVARDNSDPVEDVQ